MATLKGELELKGKAVFTEEGIKSNFSPKEILSYFKSGRLSLVCSKNEILRNKIEAIETNISDALIIRELATLFDVRFDYNEYIKQENEEIENNKQKLQLEKTAKLIELSKIIDITKKICRKKFKLELELALGTKNLTPAKLPHALDYMMRISPIGNILWTAFNLKQVEAEIILKIYKKIMTGAELTSSEKEIWNNFEKGVI